MIKPPREIGRDVWAKISRRMLNHERLARAERQRLQRQQLDRLHTASEALLEFAAVAATGQDSEAAALAQAIGDSVRALEDGLSFKPKEVA